MWRRPASPRNLFSRPVPIRVCHESRADFAGVADSLDTAAGLAGDVDRRGPGHADQVQVDLPGEFRRRSSSMRSTLGERDDQRPAGLDDHLDDGRPVRDRLAGVDHHQRHFCPLDRPLRAQ